LYNELEKLEATMQQNHHGRRVLRDVCLLLLSLALLLPCGNCMAQETHALTYRTSNPHMGSAEAIAYADDGSIFLLGENGGLWAYRRGNEGFVPQAYHSVSRDLRHIAVAPSGVVYLYGSWGKMMALAYADGRFEEIASTAIAAGQNDLAIGPDGTMYLASEYAGLLALRREGATFRLLAQLNPSDRARAVAVDRDGVVYLAAQSDPALSAYIFDGRCFTRIGSARDAALRPRNLAVGPQGAVFMTDDNGGVGAYAFSQGMLRQTAYVRDEGAAQDIVAADDGAVYVAKASDGLRAYRYDGNSLHATAHWCCPMSDARGVAVDRDGVVLLANGEDGLRAICCDVKRSACIARCDETAEARDAAVGPDGTVFLANGAGGLRAYRPSAPLLTCAAATNCDGALPIDARAVDVDWLGRVYCAHNRQISIYTYTGSTFTRIAQQPTLGDALRIAVTSDGWVYVACGEKGLQILQFDGLRLIPVAHVNEGGNVRDVAVADNGNVYVAAEEAGLRGYRWVGGDFHCSAILRPDDSFRQRVLSVAAGPGSTVFFANGLDGLRAYTFTGDTFVPGARFDLLYDGHFTGAHLLRAGPDGTLYFGYEAYPGMDESGVYACVYRDGEFHVTAHLKHAGRPQDIAPGLNGNLYVVEDDGGLSGYHYAALAAAPSLTADRNAVDFGQVPVGTARMQSVAVSNAGSVPLRIRDVTLRNIDGDAFRIARALPAEIQPGESVRIGILCRTWDHGRMNGELTLMTDDPDQSMLIIPLQANVMGNLADAPVPADVKLEQNVPNPFNPSTTIRFRVPTNEHVRLTVFNLTGQRVATLVDAALTAGWHDIHFDASALASGIYLYRLETAADVVTRRMILMK
jgi:hypothetical protein